MQRRTWLKLISTLAAGRALPAQTPPPAAAQRVTKEQAVAALKTMGLEFTDPHVEMMMPSVNRALGLYEQLRKVDIPLDTPPAMSFSPTLTGSPVPIGRSSFRSPAVRPIPRRAEPEEIAFASALQLGGMLRARRMTSTELTRLYLDRLKQYGPSLHCVVTLTEDLALDEAKQADARIRAGKRRSPLDGVPYGAKDLFDTKGILTTWGAQPYQHRVPDSDATVITKLRSAGAVLVAKLSMGALAQGGLWFGGLTRTPWNYEQSSSGSSAGSASATAAGLVGFAIGTETLGSIISPSIACGVTGLRPTFGRVSRSGAMALCWSMDKVGPICRTVADCAEVLRLIAGPDGQDLTVTHAPYNWNPRRPLGRMRVGYLASEFESMNDGKKALYTPALEELRKAGVKLEPITLPKFPLSAVNIVLDAEAATAFDDLTRSGDLETLSGQAPSDWPNQFRSSRLIPAVEYIRAQRARTIYMRQFRDLMKDWDAFVSPSPTESLTATNLTGHPQIVVPCGFAEGLPKGLVFTSGLYDEGSAMRLAHAYQQRTDWHAKRPQLHT